MAASRQYDAFGNLTASTGTWNGPFGYGGGYGYQEDGTGLKLLGHRLYDSSTGRFLTRDPIKAGRNWYAYCENDPIGAVDPEGLDLTVIGDTAGIERWDWTAEHVFGVGGTVLKKPSKKKLVEALINEPDGAEVMIWGHGGPGYINLGNGESLTTEDILYINEQRRKKGKGKLGRVWLRSCNTCQSKDWINAWLGISNDVHGFTTVTTDGPIQHWNKPVLKDPSPRPWWPWGWDKKEDKKKKKKGKLT